ncbi:Nucleic acid-binding OB-fold [Penicillium malachiteum]|uniref:Nucleic acid-binding OB-fold n=1 Tax=Penicillium malachiteum TaxID=1324776 RepID=A0AAD6HT24_9EURO|nr:Nucleic acid-binding OB-fold [Penicillium malachiteum]
MAPNHILRATMPIRSLASPMVQARSTLLQSISQSTRSASTSQSSRNTETSNASSQTTPSELAELKHLQAPALLRSYAYTLKTGTVESVGRMERTVSVIQRHTVWNKQIGKYYPKETRYLVSDPRNSLREGDVIEFSSGAPKSRRVHHVIERIITPFAVPIEDRPAVLSREEREQERERRWAEKYVRRESRRLGKEVNLSQLAESMNIEEGTSDAQIIHQIHKGNERIGKVKKLVLERTTGSPSQTPAEAL